MRNRTENQVTLLLLRHGETQANKERRYLGKTDEGLSEEGKRALLLGKEQELYPALDCLFASPMKRCMETAQILYPKLSPVTISEWEEMDFGQFEYKNHEELKDNPHYQAWIDSGGTLDFPGGESREAFALRCGNGFMKMCEELCYRMKQDADSSIHGSIRAGMIVHGGTIMALLNVFGGKQYFDSLTPNGRGYLCELTGLHDKTALYGKAGLHDETALHGKTGSCHDAALEKNKIHIKVMKEI